MTTAGNRWQHHQSFLAAGEQKLVRAIIVEMPPRITPLFLTKLGLFGAAVAAVALIGCRWSLLWLPLVPVGVFINWFGIALDGPLAVYRGEARPRLGLVEHTYDLFSQILIIVAFGLSPFLTIESAFIVLICYLLFSAYTYIRAIARHVQQMAYIGMGATEFRILMVVWAFAAHSLGIDSTAGEGVRSLDAAIAILAVIAVCGLGFKAFTDARRVAMDENGHGA
ncbi:CDP-alcohol phosphatidyltransferase [Methylosinus sp. Sm6]|uniref:CDP-alcohol phosphatidyltransferase n=1 Tax=Methylosinus sp. Sm6 TaxID=2866948 RepID=UPI001C99C2E9|nr:CDP-alcohol phosphatidyltransferase [Methylosinus sp. Sm6]MBY6244004.1 CDP-alcohol phosphatidyltransferase [Methylosinus sp. Sm6]